MRVLLTGSDGYIGVRMADYLMRCGHDVVGYDTGLHRVGWLYHATEQRPLTVTKDTREIGEDDLRGFDAVVHLAEVSNDPVGELSPDMTFAVNHRGTVRLAETAKQAGVRTFVHMSSCSVYGEMGEHPSVEGDPTNPLTAYATCKVLVERDVGSMADASFAPVFLRNATAFGASPRQRFDLVVNDLVAGAYLYKEIRLTSDGTPWRPFVHVLDIALAVDCVLRADRDAVGGEIFNVGADALNDQVIEIAQLISGLVPGCEIVIGPPSADRRNYRASFAKIRRHLTDFECQWDLERGILELLDVLRRIGFDEEQYRSRGYTRLKQVRHLLDTGQVDEQLRWQVPT
jgi:nucleoside-diphosphate-sugar epimerase